jgi:phage gpG-like protein
LTPDEFASTLGSAAIRAGALAPVLADFVEHMKGSVKENFIAGGRPVTWIPSKDHPGHRSTLVDTAALMDSATALVEGGRDVLLVAGGGGQPPAKAPTLQGGARFMAKRREGRFVTKRSRKNVTRHEIVIDARPYLLFQGVDLAYLDNGITSFVFQAAVA